MLNLLVLYFFLATQTANALELDFSLNGALHGGNQETSQFGLGLLLNLRSLEFKGIADYESSPNKIFRKFELDSNYSHKLDKKFDLFIHSVLTHDSKKKIDFSRISVFGASYKIFPWLKYSLGVGEYQENDEGNFIFSYRLKLKKDINAFEFSWTNLVFHSFTFARMKSEAGYRIKPFKLFRFGMLGGVEYDTEPLLNVKSTDWYVKGEFSFNLGS